MRPLEEGRKPLVTLCSVQRLEAIMMKLLRSLALAGLIPVVTATPAMAAWVSVTSVPLGQTARTDVVDASGQLPSRVEALSFRADTDMKCRDVTAYYRSGQSHRLWSGMLSAGRTKTIHMLPVHRDVARIGYHCWTLNKPGRLDIAANVPGRAIG